MYLQQAYEQFIKFYPDQENNKTITDDYKEIQLLEKCYSIHRHKNIYTLNSDDPIVIEYITTMKNITNNLFTSITGHLLELINKALYLKQKDSDIKLLRTRLDHFRKTYELVGKSFDKEYSMKPIEESKSDKLSNKSKKVDAKMKKISCELFIPNSTQTTKGDHAAIQQFKKRLNDFLTPNAVPRLMASGKISIEQYNTIKDIIFGVVTTRGIPEEEVAKRLRTMLANKIPKEEYHIIINIVAEVTPFAIPTLTDLDREILIAIYAGYNDWMQENPGNSISYHYTIYLGLKYGISDKFEKMKRYLYTSDKTLDKKSLIDDKIKEIAEKVLKEKGIKSKPKGGIRYIFS